MRDKEWRMKDKISYFILHTSSLESTLHTLRRHLLKSEARVAPLLVGTIFYDWTSTKGLTPWSSAQIAITQTQTALSSVKLATPLYQLPLTVLAVGQPCRQTRLSAVNVAITCEPSCCPCCHCSYRRCSYRRSWHFRTTPVGCTRSASTATVGDCKWFC